MKKTLTLIALGGLVAGTSAQAAGISAQLAGLNLADGSTLPGPSKTMVIIDVDGDGFGDFSNWDGSTWTPDPDDWVVVDEFTGKGQWNEATGDGNGFEALSGALAPSVLDTTDPQNGTSPLYQFASADAAGNTPNVVGEGDEVGLFYFPGLSIDALAPGQGQVFGFQSMGALPGPNGSLTFAALQGNDVRATFTTVPEPTSLALIGLGALGMLRRRRA